MFGVPSQGSQTAASRIFPAVSAGPQGGLNLKRYTVSDGQRKPVLMLSAEGPMPDDKGRGAVTPLVVQGVNCLTSADCVERVDFWPISADLTLRIAGHAMF
jgi:hypothetical protein